MGITLVVCAHPDDETLGMGGTLWQLAQAGEQVYVAMLGEGRSVEQAKSAGPALQRLGVQQLGVPYGLVQDNCFDDRTLFSLIREVERELAVVKPETVYTHWPHDLNQDHRQTTQAVLVATRPTPTQTVKHVYAFPVASSTEWAFGVPAKFDPNVFQSLSPEALVAKCEALACYETERRPHPHPRSQDGLTAQAMVWGSVAGCALAEPFVLLRSLR